MDTADPSGSSSKRLVTQADADRCCAASERGHSTPSPSAFVLAVAFAVVPSPVPLVLPAPEMPLRASPLPGTVPATHVPTHLLLSVYLV
jgi:hypothetical protein